MLFGQQPNSQLFWVVCCSWKLKLDLIFFIHSFPSYIQSFVYLCFKCLHHYCCHITRGNMWIIGEFCSSSHDFNFLLDLELFICCRKASCRDPLCLQVILTGGFFWNRTVQADSFVVVVHNTYSSGDFVGITCLGKEVKVWGLLPSSIFHWAQGV